MKLFVAYAIIFTTTFTDVYAIRLLTPFSLGYRVRALPAIQRQLYHLPPARWFSQLLDHFNAAETRTWQQRYFVNDSFYLPDGPAFLMIGSEGSVDYAWAATGQWIEWAQQFNAICFYLEHRYYGESRPTEDINVKNLQYLSSEQALGDLALFRSAMVDHHGLQNAKWIVFGGSYSGSLAAWLRLKYPHLVDGAVASSAPLVAKINYIELLGLTADALSNVSSTCNSAVRTAVNQMDDELAREEQGGENSVENLNVANLFSTLSWGFAGVVQYNNDRQVFDGPTVNDITVENVCGIMDDNSTGPQIDRYAKVNRFIMNGKNTLCLSIAYDDLIAYLRSFTWDSPGVVEGSRQWYYQTCTEFGWHKSSDLVTQPFGYKFPLSFFTDQCAHIFGSKFNRTLMETTINQTNIIYGGKGIQVTKVIFPYGMVDPWQPLGISQDINSEARVLLIPGASHCADMSPSSPRDSQGIIAARETIRQQIAAWLAETANYYLNETTIDRFDN